MLVIHHANIHTLNPKQELVTALAIDQGRILAVGKDDEILAAFDDSYKLNVNGRTLLPGLTDAHIHLEEYAFAQQKVDCETQSQSECLERVATRIRGSQPGEWIMGHGWNQNNWVEGYGSAQQLDRISPNNPVFLTHKSLHSAWVNSITLRLAGIDRNTTNPEAGRISHQENGDPDGILFESAVNLIYSIVPEPSPIQVAQAFRSMFPMLWKVGLTGVHDFDSRRCLSALQILHQAHELKMRVAKGIPLEQLPAAIDLGLHSGFGDDMLRIGPVKLFADGALGPQTAAMLEPYEDDPQNRGILMLGAGELYEYGRRAVENSLSLAVHAIGDRANREVLNAYAQLRHFERSLHPQEKSQLRHRIEHVQVLNPDEVSRFAELSITASMQPIHATSDMRMADRYWGKRSAYAYAWRSLLSHGACLVFGSDAPVESPNPFWGIHAAVTRQRADGNPSAGGWYAEQRINVSEAILAYTTGPAFTVNMENRLGRLAPGYLADLIILNQDPYSCPPDELLNIRPVATMVGGDWAYSELE